VKLGKLINSQFQTSLAKLMHQDLPLKTAFALRGIVRRNNEEISKYEEVRSEALKRFAKKGEDGKVAVDSNNLVRFDEDNGKLFSQEMEALLTAEVNIGSINLSDLGDKITLSTVDLMSLEDILTEEK